MSYYRAAKNVCVCVCVCVCVYWDKQTKEEKLAFVREYREGREGGREEETAIKIILGIPYLGAPTKKMGSQ